MPAFRFRLVPFITTLILVTLGCSLSYWQTQRAQKKESIEAILKAREANPVMDFPATIDLAQMEYARVKLTGEFVKEWPVYLDNRPMNGHAGLVVMMPFKLHGMPKYVLIARGWVPRNAGNRFAIKSYETPSGIIEIQGIVKASSGHILQLGNAAPLRPGQLIQNLEVDEFNKASTYPAYPLIVEQTSDTNDGLLRDWPRASVGSERNRGYAFQWMALAAMALLFYLVSGFKRRESGKLSE